MRWLPLLVLLIGVALMLVYLVATDPGRIEAQRHGPTNDSEAACLARDLTPQARKRLGCP